LCVGDALYMLFPHFVAVLFFDVSNTYGAVPSWILCIILRVLSEFSFNILDLMASQYQVESLP